jgi:CheY-like chemotaxis protein
VVDDSIVVRKVLCFTVWQLPGFANAVVDEAGNGAIALKKLRQNRYRLVLSDVRMPLMDGLELVTRIRGELGDWDTPVVLISTLGTQDDIDRGIAAGATAYVMKPLSPHHIRLALLEVLERG